MIDKSEVDIKKIRGTKLNDKIDYYEYIKSDAWKEKRKQYYASKKLTRSGKHYCYICDCSDKPLDLHHRTYNRLGNEKLQDLVLVCRDCHKEIHRVQEEENKSVWDATLLVYKRNKNKRRDESKKRKAKKSKRKRQKHKSKKKLKVKTTQTLIKEKLEENKINEIFVDLVRIEFDKIVCNKTRWGRNEIKKVFDTAILNAISEFSKTRRT